MMGRHSLEWRIVDHLGANYPVTARQLAGALHLSEKRILVELRRMETKGMVELDVLPDAVFVRCLVVFRRQDGEGGGGPSKDRDMKGRGKKDPKKDGNAGDDPAYV
jgi:predicted ArsR family transcriptional regulator